MTAIAQPENAALLAGALPAVIHSEKSTSTALLFWKL
jgi:hypothetical protein